MFKKRLLPISLVLAIIISAFFVMSFGTTAQDMETMTVEVAGDGLSFAMQSEPADEETGMPLNGNPFIIRGYIYPEGTLEGTNGVLEDGSAEFPDLVIGTWICSGFFYGESMAMPTGPFAVTTQIFDFGDDGTVVSHGYEMMDVDMAWERAVVGGTGDYSGATGVQSQVYHGDNVTVGPTFTITLPAN